jgi:cytochrome c553
MRQLYFLNQRFQISLIVNCDRWRTSKGVSVRKIIRMAVVLGFLVLVLSGTRVLAQDSEALYTKKCANCHAKDGSGHTAVATKFTVPDLRSKRIKDMSVADIYNSIAQGTQHKEYPHAFLHTGLTEEQIQGLVKYIRALSQQATPRAAPKL